MDYTRKITDVVNAEYFQCTVCGEVKHCAEFGKRNDRPKGVTSKCKLCKRLNEKNYYINNPDKLIAKKENKQKWLADPANKEKAKKSWVRRDIAVRQELFQIILQYKDAPCTDCGKRYPHYVMDFDHIDPTNKIASISKLSVWRGNKDNLLAEIKKCELVCSNCHRERTHNRFLAKNLIDNTLSTAI